ncbi:MAG: DUF624 domain-containing protein [Eubacteriales bacterium]|nr:DUF624 domain-containing protein [Eubacteriales bacterium]
MKLFDNDSPLGILLGRFGDLILVNLLFIISCIPIITIGDALTSLYYTTLKMAKGTSSSAVHSFCSSFKSNFKQSTYVWLGILAVTALAVTNILILRQSHSGMAFSAIVFNIAVLILMAVITLYIFAVIAAFDNTVKNLMRNAIIFASAYLHITLLMLLAIGIPVLVTILIPQWFGVLITFWFFIGFSLLAYFNSSLLMKIFIKHLPGELE